MELASWRGGQSRIPVASRGALESLELLISVKNVRKEKVYTSFFHVFLLSPNTVIFSDQPFERDI